MTGRKHDLMLAGSGFAAGLVTGLWLGRWADDGGPRASGRSLSVDEPTVTYGHNLPDSLARREPESGRPRYGGTGAIGVPLTSVGTTPSGGDDRA